jgi:hypothetical protein
MVALDQYYAPDGPVGTTGVMVRDRSGRPAVVRPDDQGGMTNELIVD